MKKEQLEALERRLDECAKDERGNPLVCSGCVDVSRDIPFPGVASGNHGCWFCVRNKLIDQMQDNLKKAFGEVPPHITQWPDHTKPIRTPMDCYRSKDMQEQTALWRSQERTLAGC